jgi:hypothetical protein
MRSAAWVRTDLRGHRSGARGQTGARTARSGGSLALLAQPV